MNGQQLKNHNQLARHQRALDILRDELKDMRYRIKDLFSEIEPHCCTCNAFHRLPKDKLLLIKGVEHRKTCFFEILKRKYDR